MHFVSLLVLSTLTVCIPLVRGDIDYNICDPINQTVVPPPPPALPKSFSTVIEWKLLEHNSSTIVEEYQDGIRNITSQVITSFGRSIKLIYDYKVQQFFVLDPDTGCSVTQLGSVEFYQGKLWQSALQMIYDEAKRGSARFINTTRVRGIVSQQWRSCIYIYSSTEITAQVDMYFSHQGWAMAQSIPSMMVPVRFEITGSVNQGGNQSHFSAIGDFIEFYPVPKFDQTKLQPSPGVYCPGRRSRRPMNPLPSSFSVVFEKIDQDFKKITYESIWFDAEKKLVRRDYKEALPNDPDPSRDIYDLNLGIHYMIDPYMGNCQGPSILRVGDLFIAGGPNDTIRMKTADEMFHFENAFTQYVGVRSTRGVLCDVWGGYYLDQDANRNFSIEWYFTQAEWLEAVDLVLQPGSLFRMDIWKGGSDKPIVTNVLQLDGTAPPQSVFNVVPCYTTKTRIIAHFQVQNFVRLDEVSDQYLKDLLHTELTNRALVPPLRVAETSLTFANNTEIYFAATLVDQASQVNRHLAPPPPQQHNLEVTYRFLRATMEGNFTLNVTSTEGRLMKIVSRDLVRVDYGQEFTTTAAPTTSTTVERTPPPPTQAPTTVKPLVPSQVTTEEKVPPTMPLSTSTASTASTTTATTQQTTKTVPTTSSPSSASPQTPPIAVQTSITPCVCPKMTCPTTSTPKPVTCPTLPTASDPGTTKQPPQTTKSQTPSSTRRVTIPLAQHQPSAPQTGVNKGLVGGLAVMMLVVGIVLGVVALKLFIRYRERHDPDARGLFSKYMDDDTKY